MKSFVLSIPKSPAEIENHYFCECGNKFINKSGCECCGNENFYTYEDVKRYNPKLYEIKTIKNGVECFIEYPVFNGEIVCKKERLAILINKEIKLNQKFRENFDFYYDEIAAIVEKYLKFLGLWNERKRVFKLLKKLESRRVLEIIKVKDSEVLLWNVYDKDISVEEFFEKLLKDSPKSVKKAVFEKYKQQVFDLSYNPLMDILILRVVEDVNHQRELIKSLTQHEYNEVDEVYNFIDFLRKFEQPQVVSFLKKSIQSGMFLNYIHKFNQSSIKKFYKSIEETIISGSDFVEYEYPFDKIYKFSYFIFKLPQNSAELKEYANKLKNCLSNYVGVHNKRYLIFGVFQKGELKYAVNFDTQKKFIVEAKGFANSNINEKDYNVIESFFEKFGNCF